MYQLVPPYLSVPGKKEELFEHMVQFRQRKYARKEDDHKVLAALDIEPRNAHQRSFYDLNYALKQQGTLMEDIGSGTCQRRAAQCRLDHLGQVKSHPQFVNDPRRLVAHRQRLELLRSLGRVNEFAAEEEAGKRAAMKVNLNELVPDALELYMKGDIKVRSFTKAKIDAILLVVFDDSIPKNAKKSERLAKLNELHTKDPSKISDYLSGALTALSEPVPAAPPDQPSLLPSLPAAATATTGGSTSCRATSGMAHWLYFRCARAVKDHVYSVDALQLSYLVLNAMEEIKNDPGYDIDELENIGCSSLFFSAFGKVSKERDIEFIFELEEKLQELFDDMDLNKQRLKDVSPGY
mmetsp:Transcript_38277/g.92335  ORF Transcript_38277/g.92335 Transcript_38277/m.92335 type:complete len:351 (-) Transcript_38277:10-1062(-)